MVMPMDWGIFRTGESFRQAELPRNAQQNAQHPDARANEELRPIVCSQAALAEKLGHSPHTAGLANTLKTRGILSRFQPPDSKGGKWKFWLTDTDKHEEIRKDISGKPRRRKASEVNRKKS
jgi:hypothetical protein